MRDITVTVRDQFTSKDGGIWEYWVVISCKGKEITPHVFESERYKAEYHAAEYDHVLNGFPAPDILDYSPATERTHGY